MNPKELVQQLEDVTVFLENCGDRYWPTILRRLQDAASRLGDSNRAGLQRVLSQMDPLFGGMGSLNDLNLSHRNGHLVADPQQANAEFRLKVDALFAAWSKCRTDVSETQ